MRIKKYLQYINEALGIAEPILKISDLVLDQITKEFTSFFLTNKPNLVKKVIIKVPTLVRSESIWRKFMVKDVELTVDFRRIPAEEFEHKFQVTSKLKNFNTFGACSDLIDPTKVDFDDFSEVSLLNEDGTISLKIEAGAYISSKYTEREFKDLCTEFESAIIHELTHAYEGSIVYKTTGNPLPTGVTVALDVNTDNIPKEVWEVWADEFTYHYYWAEPHEIRAMVADALPYVKKYNIEELKTICPSYRFITQMLKFDPIKLKADLIEKIKEFMPDKDPEAVLNSIKDNFANELLQYNLDHEQVSSIDPYAIDEMTFDEFMESARKKIHDAGEKIRRKILRLYSRERQ